MLPGHIGVAALLFVLLLFAYARGMLGGGDVKILTVAFLWTGLDCALPFALCLLGFSMLHVEASRRGLVASPMRADGRPRIAYAPAVAGALIVVFVIGCLDPITATTP
jgi:prepilin peptidase CpaA